MQPTPREAVDRVARMYHTCQEAAQALGITTRAFSRLCRRHGIESPYTRHRRRKTEVRDPSPPPDHPHPWSRPC